MISSSNSRAVAAEEAVQWLLRQQEASFSPAQRRELAEWLLQSPLHVDEYLAASTTWAILSATDARTGYSRDELVAAAKAELATDNVVQLLQRSENVALARPMASVTRRTWVRAAGIIGLIGASVLAGLFLARSPEYATGHGEQRRVPLADGSVITLNTDSHVRLLSDKKRRAIELLSGEVRFQVAKDPNRPFVVIADRTEVRALGTIFNVRADSQRTQVAVVEGHVAVTLAESAIDETDPASRGSGEPPLGAAIRKAELRAGERAIIGAGFIAVGVGQPVEVANAWTERKLIFRDEALSSVITEFNRYRLHPLNLDDSQLGALKISGVFNIEDPDSLLSYLKNFETVTIRRDPNGAEHLVRSGATSARAL